MDPLLLAGAVVLAGVLVAAAIIVALRSGSGAAESAKREAEMRAEELERSVAQLISAQSELSGRLSQMSEVNQSSQSAMQKTLEERLDSLKHQMGESLAQQTEKTGETLSQLNERLAVIDQAQKNITELSGQVVGLQEILSNKQARGAFGEVQMNDLVTSILPPSAYAFQVTLSNNKRADCLLQLPNPPGPMVVDAKFPLESYHALRAAESDHDKTQAGRAFKTAILKHVLDIRERYIVPGETAESAMMFVPSEAIYAELHANHPDIVENSFKARVWIVSPTTLMATLNTVRAVMKDARMRDLAHVIQHEVGRMMEDVGRLKKRAENLDRHFAQTAKDVREIITSTEKIGRAAERIDEVQLEDDAEAAKPVSKGAKQEPLAIPESADE